VSSETFDNTFSLNFLCSVFSGSLQTIFLSNTYDPNPRVQIIVGVVGRGWADLKNLKLFIHTYFTCVFKF